MVETLLRLIAPRELALSFVLVIVAFCCRVDNAFMMMLDLHGVVPAFLASLFAGTLAGCAATAWRSARSGRSQMAWISACTASGVAGLTAAGFVHALPSLWCALIGGALLGFGLSCLLCRWWAQYAALAPVRLLATMGASALLASVLWYLLKQVGTFPVTCFCLVVCALCGGLLLLVSLAASGKPGEDAPCEQGGSAAGEARSGETDAAVKASVDGRAAFRAPAIAAVIGLLFNFFTLGLTFWPAAAGLSTSSVTCKPISYALVLAAMVVVALRVPSPRRAVISFSHMALPIAAAIVLASPFIEIVVDTGAVPLYSPITYVGIALFNVLGLALPLCAAASDARSNARAAAYLAACMLAFGAGMAVFRMLGQGAQVVSLCIMAAYLAGLVIASVRSTAAHADREGAALAEPTTGGEGPAEPSDPRQTACARIADQYALSPREAEILRFLARGHGAKYIAERLFISADTVRTHCKRIYEKTGVHAKDELLELVERAE